LEQKTTRKTILDGFSTTLNSFIVDLQTNSGYKSAVNPNCFGNKSTVYYKTNNSNSIHLCSLAFDNSLDDKVQTGIISLSSILNSIQASSAAAEY